MIDGDQHRFLNINKKDKPIGGRFNWDIRYPSLKDMLQTHRSMTDKKNIPTNGNEFEFVDGKNQKRKINVDINPQKKFKK